MFDQTHRAMQLQPTFMLMSIFVGVNTASRSGIESVQRTHRSEISEDTLAQEWVNYVAKKTSQKGFPGVRPS